MSLLVIGIVYCVLVILASLVGGWLPQWFRMTHSRMQPAISFVAGVVLGIGLLHLLPHGYAKFMEVQTEGAIDRSVWWLLIGFLSTFFLQRLFHFHTHEVPDDLIEHHQAPHDCSHVHAAAAETHADDACQIASRQHDHRFTWSGIFFGLTIHSLVDGVSLAAAMSAESEHTGGLWAGFAFFLAVFLHKPFDSLSITGLMMASGWSAPWRNAVNVAYALVMPLGMLLFYVGMGQAASSAVAIVGATLCFAAGACLCIASSDLLPELQFHSHDRFKLSAALAVGLALAWGLIFAENQGHAHHHSGAVESRHHVSHDH